jgi:hypothetical protein
MKLIIARSVPKEESIKRGTVPHDLKTENNVGIAKILRASTGTIHMEPLYVSQDQPGANTRAATVDSLLFTVQKSCL